ncbi:MAG TPA: membrane protein insertase YidC [Bacillota bacterium]|nr:membrane protein insertase YidC [Bacillota bacterium]
MRKKYVILSLIIGLSLLLAGCTEVDQPITAESEGIWNTIFVYPLSWSITKIAEIFNNSYGLSIIIVTIFIRLLLMPLNVKQIKSSRAMQEIQPKLAELREKYSSKDQNTQMKLQQETMQLMKEHNVNPLAGCLPIFVQMPILIAMYHAIVRTEEIRNYSFLWFQLGSPDFILPLLTAFFTFLQQKIMMSINPSANMNPQIAMQMKMMLYMMPIMIGVMAFFFPAALALYWVTGNIFMVVQILLINKPMMSNMNSGGVKK